MQLYKFMNGKNHIIELDEQLAARMVSNNKAYSYIDKQVEIERVLEKPIEKQEAQEVPEVKRAYNRKK